MVSPNLQVCNSESESERVSIPSSLSMDAILHTENRRIQSRVVRVVTSRCGPFGWNIEWIHRWQPFFFSFSLFSFCVHSFDRCSRISSGTVALKGNMQWGQLKERREREREREREKKRDSALSDTPCYKHLSLTREQLLNCNLTHCPLPAVHPERRKREKQAFVQRINGWLSTQWLLLKLQAALLFTLPFATFFVPFPHTGTTIRLLSSPYL